MQTYERLKIIYETMTKQITRTSSAWKEYLSFASKLYKYPFDNTLLIYAQNHDVTALATTPIWNKLGRRINKNEKGIAVCEYTNAKLTIKYLFDISQTKGIFQPNIWKVDENIEKELGTRIKLMYNCDGNFEAIVEFMAKSRVLQAFNEYMQDFEQDIREHFFEHLPQKGLYEEVQRNLIQSVKYFVLSKCGLKIEEEFVFNTINHFNTIPLISRLGYITTEVSKDILLEIERNIKIIESERSIKNEHFDLQEKGERSHSREIRKNGDELSQGNQSNQISNITHVWRTNPNHDKSGRTGKRNIGKIDSTTIENQSNANDRGNNGTDTPHEYIENNSRRNNIDGDSEQKKIESPKKEESLRGGSFFDDIEEYNSSFLEANTNDVKNEIIVLIVEPDKKAYLKNISDDYDSLKKIIDGTITTVELDKDIDAICADDVNFENIPVNRVTEGMPIFDTFIVARVNPETAEYISLTENDIEKYMNQFEKPLDYEVEDVELPEMVNRNIFEPQNFKYKDDFNIYEGGVKTKYKNNVAAIKLIRNLEAEKRYATQEEQVILAKYVGWGGLAEVFNKISINFSNEYKELKLLLTEEEYELAKESVTTAYYTDPNIIKYIYKALSQFGFEGNENRKILDPAMGTGNFYSVIPDDMAKSSLYGVELDNITGRISKLLYPNVNVQIKGYEETSFPDNYFDIAIGNIPFNSIKVFDERYKDENFLIHDYFFAATLDKVKIGGVIAFVTSSGTLDKQSENAREYIARRAELIGAIRLPNTVFKEIAGTEVTSDIIFLKKRDEVLTCEYKDLPSWVQSKWNDFYYNQYFHENPHMMLGKMALGKGQYGRNINTLEPHEDSNLYKLLDNAVDNLQAQFTAINVIETNEEIEESIFPVDSNVKNFTFTVIDEDIYYRENNLMIKQDVAGKKEERIKGLCGIRNALREVINIQNKEYDEADLKIAQQQLNKEYDAFIKKNGYINNKQNSHVFGDDDDYPLLRSIEDLQKDGSYKKTAIFSKATIRVQTPIDKAETALDALIISLNMCARVDILYMSKLYDKTPDDIILELGNKIFLNPEKYYGDYYVGWELDEEYLSGDVKYKLEYASLKAEEYPELFLRNKEALETIQPEPLKVSEIGFRIGSPWIPVKYYQQFIKDIFDSGYGINVEYAEHSNIWNISKKRIEPNSIKVNTTYGTSRINAYEIMQATLNLQNVTIKDRVFYYDEDGNKREKYVVNSKETMIARAKQQQMKEVFSSWLFAEKERSEVLLKIYNDKFNNIRPRKYDGSFLDFPEMSEELDLVNHQKNTVARIIFAGKALVAQAVGSGKTFTLIAAGMKLKQLGIIKKPAYVVPKPITEQWANEFYRLYPTANILVARDKDFKKENRKKFVAKMASGEYDGIIIGHTAFEKIRISKERQEKYLKSKIADLAKEIEEAKARRGEKWTIKQMVIAMKNLEYRLDKLNQTDKKDDMLDFEQLGVDFIFVDESHVFKNCFNYTKMRNIAGISTTSSQRAMDMLLKCQYIQEISNGKNVVFASGTPVSNSMAELYINQMYLQPEELHKAGLTYFDNWAATFGEVTSSLEINPEGSGYRMRTRFAKFHNLPELMKMFTLVADIQTADMLNLDVPQINGGKPEIVSTKRTPYQKELVNWLVERSEKVRAGTIKPNEDNMLCITMDAKLLSIDPRLLNSNASNDENSKLNIAINNIYDIWKNTTNKRSTQLVFSDVGTPNTNKFNVYDEIKKVLCEKGVPVNEIAFVHDATTDIKREELFEKMRNGDIRIMIGSTSKLGTGVNVQHKIISIHHIDCPWRPSDLTQRDGRGIRQLNENEMVSIFRYVTEGTFDSYLWQIQEQKLRYISQVMTGKSIMRSCNDLDETVLEAAQIKAIAAGNSDIAKKMKIDNEVVNLRILKADWQNKKIELEKNIQSHYPQAILLKENQIKQIEQDLKVISENQTKDFSMGFGNQLITDKEKAGEHILTLKKALLRTDKEKYICEYRGFSLAFEQNICNIYLKISGNYSYTVELGYSAIGNITRIDNILDKLPDYLQGEKSKLYDLNKQFENTKIEILKQFEYEEKLSELIAIQAELDAKLEFGKEIDNVIEVEALELDDENEVNEEELAM